MQSPLAMPPTGEVPRQPQFHNSLSLPRIPRPLLAIGLAVAAVLLFLTFTVRHFLQMSSDGARGGSTVQASSPPYAVVFQSTPSQRMAPVATQTIHDLTRWLKLQSVSDTKSGKNSSDYPVTVRLYLSGRILLIAAGTHGRVLEEHGEYSQVKILDGLHKGATGYTSRDNMRRAGQSTTPPAQILTIP